MPNNRIIYSCVQLNFKDTRADATSRIMGILTDA